MFQVTERVCVKDYPFDYDGKKFTFEKDLSIMIPIYGFHMDPLYYSEPEKFDPDRFNEENRTKIDPDTYMPFGRLTKLIILKLFLCSLNFRTWTAKLHRIKICSNGNQNSFLLFAAQLFHRSDREDPNSITVYCQSYRL